MKRVHCFAVMMSAFAMAAVVGCTRVPTGASKGGEKVVKKVDDDHDHGPGPHGGTIIEFGKWHGEFTVDHKAQEATVYILGGDAEKPAPIEAEKLLLSIKAPQFQVDLKAVPQDGDPKGKSSRFVAKHANFGKEQEFEGTLSGRVEGEQYARDFKEEEHKDHKHDKK